MARRKSIRRVGGFRPNAGLFAAGALMLAAFAALGWRQAAPSLLDDPLGAVMGAVVAPIRAGQGLIDRIAAMWTAAGRVAELEAENARLEEWRALAQALAERNERYEQLLGVPASVEGGPDYLPASPTAAGVTARLVLDPAGPFRRTLLANAGADHGVRRGYAAVNENGLVGRVVTVGRRSSRVLLLDDYNSRVPVMGQLSRVRAILAGDASAAPRLQGVLSLSAPRMDNVIGARPPLAGEPVVTSGDGGLYPPGLVVGYAAQAEDGVWRVRLAAARAAIDFVRIMPFSPVEAPEAAPAPEEDLPAPGRSARELQAARAPAAQSAGADAAAPRAAPRIDPAAAAGFRLPAIAPAEPLMSTPPVARPAPPETNEPGQPDAPPP